MLCGFESTPIQHSTDEYWFKSLHPHQRKAPSLGLELFRWSCGEEDLNRVPAGKSHIRKKILEQRFGDFLLYKAVRAGSISDRKTCCYYNLSFCEIHLFCYEKHFLLIFSCAPSRKNGCFSIKYNCMPLAISDDCDIMCFVTRKRLCGRRADAGHPAKPGIIII